MDWLAWEEYSYNTAHHTAINTTPFRAIYGRDPPKLLRYGATPTANAQVEELLSQRDGLLEELRENIGNAQVKMVSAANKHRRELVFDVGDMVYLKLRPYRQKSVALRRNEKLSPRYFGPYKVEKRIGNVAYKLDLPYHSAIHPVFHISQLKKAVPADKVAQPLPQILTQDLEWATEPEAVLEVRRADKGKEAEVLVKWRGLPSCENTWEAISEVQKKYPAFHLEDKVSLIGGSIDRMAYPFAVMTKKQRSCRGKRVSG